MILFLGPPGPCAMMAIPVPRPMCRWVPVSIDSTFSKRDVALHELIDVTDAVRSVYCPMA